MPVRLPRTVFDRYERLSLYNSPYPAHDQGCAIDLYPATGTPSPVAGEVLETRTVRAPSKPYAVEHDYLILVAVEEPESAAGLVARVLHVDPGVAAGDRIEVGDSLGEMVRSGYFAPWVGNHVHLGFRPPDANLHRAGGSLPVAVDVDPEPLAWDGTGTVGDVGGTYALLDSPAHPAPGETWVGVAADATDGQGALDGGLPHYEGGGLLGNGREVPVSLLGSAVGTADGRTVEWSDLTVLANGRPITGLSLFLAREAFGAKLICPDETFEVGEEVQVRITPRG